MLRAVALASILGLAAGAAFAQPPNDPSGYGAQPQGQPPSPPPDQGYAQGTGGGAGYGAPGDGQGGGGGGRWAADPQTHALRQQMRAACAADVSTYCAGAGQPGGDGRQGDRRALHACMMANQARFSPSCQSAIANLRTHMHEMRGQGGPPGAMPPGADGTPQNPPPQ